MPSIVYGILCRSFTVVEVMYGTQLCVPSCAVPASTNTNTTYVQRYRTFTFIYTVYIQNTSTQYACTAAWPQQRIVDSTASELPPGVIPSPSSPFLRLSLQCAPPQPSQASRLKPLLKHSQSSKRKVMSGPWVKTLPTEPNLGNY